MEQVAIPVHPLEVAVKEPSSWLTSPCPLKAASWLLKPCGTPSDSLDLT